MTAGPTGAEEARARLAAVRTEVAKAVVGQDAAVSGLLVALLCGGHVLLEGVPGVAKTLLVRTLAHVLGCDFNRIQFTPDLMPADITGTNIFDLAKNAFTFAPGPVFTTFLLADEINRAPAKTQSALLQAMQERLVSIDRHTYALPPNFTVFATQNPVESEGTYPLPEAQRDRFLFKITMSYPSRDEEYHLAQRVLGPSSPEATLASGAVQPVVDAATLTALRATLQSLVVREELVAYAVDLVRTTRSHEAVLVGAGPRATLALLLAGRASAPPSGRGFVTPDDPPAPAAPVPRPARVPPPGFRPRGPPPAAAVAQILERVAVPR